MVKLNYIDPHQQQQQQHEQDFSILVSFIGSVGVLMCLIVTVMGIKLWWFKRRLNFEQTSLQNGAAGGQSPDVVTRREKKLRFSKDKRWSQQVYQTVDVHGVFKQKNEDDVEIQRPQQLPPVRIRHAESAPSLILPPPRFKRMQETSSPKDLDISEEVNETIKTRNNDPGLSESRPTSFEFDKANTRISLTFEELENQLKHREEELATQNTVKDAPEPPKRFNRSNSSLLKTSDKEQNAHRFLKSSQSIAVSDYRKVVERRPTGFHRPTEDDLTKIEDLEEPRFEKFGDRRPTGYIKYEEVDFYLSDVCKDHGNTKDIDEGTIMYDSGYLENQTNDTAVEALRNEKIIYTNGNLGSSNLYKTNAGYDEPFPLHVNQKELSGELNDISHSSSSSQKDLESKILNPVQSNEVNALKFDFAPPVKRQQLLDDFSYLDHVDIKSKEVKNFSPGNMEPQAFAFCDEDVEDVYSEPASINLAQLNKPSEFQTDSFEKSDHKLQIEIVNHEAFDLDNPAKSVRYESHRDGETKIAAFYGQASATDIFKTSDEKGSSELRGDNQASEFNQITESFKCPNVSSEFEKGIQSYKQSFLKDNMEKFFLTQKNATEFIAYDNIKRNKYSESTPTSTTEEKDKITLDQRTVSEFPNFEFEKQETDDELGAKQNVKFEFDQITDNEIKSQKMHTETKDIKEHLYEEIQIPEVKFEELYEEIHTPPAMNSYKRGDICEIRTFQREIETQTEIDRPIVFITSTKSFNDDKDLSTSSVWQELERDIQFDNSTQNIDEEFDKIRHCLEINEADFLEIKKELQLNSPMTEPMPSVNNIESISLKSSGFGKSIEDDWENFEKLKTVTNDHQYEIVRGQKEIQITFNAETKTGKRNGVSTVSILKETKMEQISDETGRLEVKPRKSKVTFDSNTEEHVIPARRSISDEESEYEECDDGYTWKEEFYDDDDDDDVYNKPPPPIPTERVTITKSPGDKMDLSPAHTTPSTISLFGSQITQEANEAIEDSWSAIRKHRHLTLQFQNLTLDSPLSPPPPSFPPPPLPATRSLDHSNGNDAPRPAIRNPMAQLAIQRAKEIRFEMGDFKPRSIKDSKQAQTKRTNMEIIELRNDTEA